MLDIYHEIDDSSFQSGENLPPAQVTWFTTDQNIILASTYLVFSNHIKLHIVSFTKKLSQELRPQKVEE